MSPLCPPPTTTTSAPAAIAGPTFAESELPVAEGDTPDGDTYGSQPAKVSIIFRTSGPSG